LLSSAPAEAPNGIEPAAVPNARSGSLAGGRLALPRGGRVARAVATATDSAAGGPPVATTMPRAMVDRVWEGDRTTRGADGRAGGPPATQAARRGLLARRAAPRAVAAAAAAPLNTLTARSRGPHALLTWLA